MQLEKLQDQKPECHLEWPNSYNDNYGIRILTYRTICALCIDLSTFSISVSKFVE